MTAVSRPQAEPVAGTTDVLVPITLELAPMRVLLIIDVADDPTYRTLEPQLLAKPGGVGLVLLAYRHDGYVELYAEPDVPVDPSGYDGLERTDQRVTLTIGRIGPWRTRQRRPLLGVLFRLPIFRRWPTTYRWVATLDLTASPNFGWTSRWSRHL